MRILLVDDDLIVREAIRETLMEQGHEVVETWNGYVGLRMFETLGPFDAVLTDFQMPYVHGLEMAEKIRALDANVPITIMSGDGSVRSKIPASFRFWEKRGSLPEIEALFAAA